MNRCARFLALALWLAVPGAAAAQISAQEGVLSAKPAAVLVTARVDGDVTVDCGKGAVTVKAAPFVETGTGWLVDGRGFVVTNAHVVDPVHTGPLWVEQALRKSGVEKACGMQGAKAARATVKTTPSLAVMLANGKVLPAEVKKFSAPLRLDGNGKALPESGRDLALLRLAPGVYPSLALGAEMPRIGEPVHIIGFPGVVLGHELLSKQAAVEATVTTGAVSSFKTDVIGQDVIQTDASAAHGNSGGPAVSTAGAVLGVLTFVSLGREGDVVQGFNFLVPVRDVRKFLEGTDAAKPVASAFDTAWRAGLHDLFAARYRAAVGRLAEADKAVPGLPDVKRALNEAQNPPPTPFPWAWLTAAVVVVSGLVYGVIAYRRWQRNRFRIKASDVAKMMEDGQNPLIVDARHLAAGQTGGLRIPGALRVEPEALAGGNLPTDAARDRVVVAYCT